MADIREILNDLDEQRTCMYEVGDDACGDVITDAIQVIEELQEQNKWHLCEEELPKESTCYLCAVKHRFNKDDRWRWTVTDIVLFGTENNWMVDENKNEVIAWRELSKFEEE